MYLAFFVILTLIAQSGHSLVFRLPTLNHDVFPGESNLIVWGDFGDVTEVNVYLAHGTPSNYTILQTLGENIPSSTDSMMYHLPTTLPETNVFFMLEGNDSPKSVVTRSVHVDLTRGGFNTFPSISLPSISFPSNFPFGATFPPSVSTPDPTTPSFHTYSGLPIPAIIGISMGSLFLVLVLLTTVTLMRRRTMIKKRRALLLQQQNNVSPTPPPKWSPKPTDINVNVSVQGSQENQLPQQQQQQPSQHTEYNYNYQPEYNYNPQYQYEQQMDISYTNQPQIQELLYSSPGGFVMPSPKTALDTATPYSPANTDSTKTSTPVFENKPNLVSPPPHAHHKPNENSFEVPTIQKPHSHSSP